ncbi:50S ribosomal protein L2 [Candidatus Woesearchaeota archaeon]|nr:50S ribosomal protein L2 [Candidatus Woesearchaeota archaeon]
MGKNLIQQARGKGSPTYRSPSFKFVGKPIHPKDGDLAGKVSNLIHCAGHTAPLAHVVFEDNTDGLILASEGIAIGESILVSKNAEVKSGNVLPLDSIPEGTLVHNIELIPGDGGKFVRASGTFAKIVGKKNDEVSVMLPSKKIKIFNSKCRASVGIVAGGGRLDKPFLKAGRRMHKMRARNKLYPRSSAASMNAVDHPFGNKHSSRKSKARPISRNAPPGRKVGMVAARRTGRNKK